MKHGLAYECSPTAWQGQQAFPKANLRKTRTTTKAPLHPQRPSEWRHGIAPWHRLGHTPSATDRTSLQAEVGHNCEKSTR
mmetsp:Transcript_1723/g.3767  ORF Transcript_1723/g.3767 Transcript_1723/m.3767 type:complete len:80 (-) Transcript_1723:11-250(-)